MMIRSQNKKILIPFENGYINNCLGEISFVPFATFATDDDSYIQIGVYSTEKTALKVLDMIQDAYKNIPVIIQNFSYNTIFKMPQEDEI